MNKIRDLEKGRCSEKKKMTFIDYSTTWSLVQFHVDPTRYSIFVFHARRIPYVYLHIRPYVGSRFSNLNNWRKESNIPLLFFRYPGDKRQSQNIFCLFFFSPKKDVRVSVTNSYVTRMYVKLSPSKPPNPTQPKLGWTYRRVNKSSAIVNQITIDRSCSINTIIANRQSKTSHTPRAPDIKVHQTHAKQIKKFQFN